MLVGNAQSDDSSREPSPVRQERPRVRFHQRLQRLIGELAAERESLRDIARTLGIDESLVSRTNDKRAEPRDSRVSTVEAIVDTFRIRADYFFDRAEPASYRDYIEGTAPRASASGSVAGDTLIVDLLESGRAGAVTPEEARELRRVAALIAPSGDAAKGLDLLDAFVAGKRIKSQPMHEERAPARRR